MKLTVRQERTSRIKVNEYEFHRLVDFMSFGVKGPLSSSHVFSQYSNIPHL